MKNPQKINISFLDIVKNFIFLIYVTIMSAVGWVIILLLGFLLTKSGTKDESIIYYISSFATLFFLFGSCVFIMRELKIKLTNNIIDFIKMNWIQLLVILLAVPIMICYLGWCIEIFRVGFGAAEIFGFNAAVSGILFNIATILAELSVVFAVIKINLPNKGYK